jgi:hypothetical protein
MTCCAAPTTARPATPGRTLPGRLFGQTGLPRVRSPRVTRQQSRRAADRLAVAPALAEGFAARVLAHPGMPGADRECGEDDGQAGDQDAGPG